MVYSFMQNEGKCTMNTAKLFTNGRSQAVRLPKGCRFKSDEVGISKVGDAVILYPLNGGWDVMRRGLGSFTDDFMVDRSQPVETDKRTTL